MASEVVAIAGDVDVRQVAQRLAALPERDMRAAKLAELVTAATAVQAAWLLDALATAGRAGGPPFDVSLLAAVDLFGDDDRLPYAQRRAIYDAAEANGLAACMDLLSSSHSLGDEHAGQPRPLVPGTRPLTLGERKSLARSWDRTVLERLLIDPHVDVVRLLLDNPHLTEDDVLRIATARQASAAVLGLVLRSRRFGAALWAAWPERRPVVPVLRPTPGLAAYALRNLEGVPNLVLALFWRRPDEIEAAVARVLAEQQAGEPFIPVFLTSHPDFTVLREQRLAFEYFPFELDEAAPAPPPRWVAYLIATLELTMRRWGVRQIVGL